MNNRNYYYINSARRHITNPFNPFMPGCAFGALVVSSVHNSACRGPINMVSMAKRIYYVLPIHFACSIVPIGPLVAKLQQVYAPTPKNVGTLI